MPIPHRREQTAQGTKTAQALGSLLGEHILHVAHITSQYVPSILDTGRETLEEAEADVGHLVIHHHGMIEETKLHALLARLEQGGGLHRIARSLLVFNIRSQSLQTILVGSSRGQHVVYTAQLQLEVVEGIHLLAIDGQNLVALGQTEFAGRRILQNAVYLKRHIQLYETRILLDHVEHIEVALQRGSSSCHHG